MSSEHINDSVASAIKNSSHLSSRHLRYEAAEGGQITLRGTVASYFEKQLVQETVREVNGVETINNMIQVSWADSISATV